MKKLFIYKLLIILIMSIVWAYFYPKLPDLVPIHWWPDWTADKMWSKLINILSFPILNLAVTLLFPILYKIDPKRENYAKFSNIWEIIQFSIIWYFAYLYFVIIYASLNNDANVAQFMLVWIWVLFIILWNFMWKIRQNYFVWIKLPWTLANEEVWNKTHRFSWKLFVIWWILILLNSFILFYPFIVFLIILTFIIILPWIYSYLIFKKHN